MAAVEWTTHEDDEVAILELNEPDKLNALSHDIRAGLRKGLHEFADRGDLRSLIITGAGRAFCAGGDLSQMPGDTVGAKHFLQDVIELLSIPERIPKPVIAAVNGPALGGGFELALACDLIVAAEGAYFAAPEALVGLAPAFGMVRLQQKIGPNLAKEMAFTGRRMPAQEALERGLANRVVANGAEMDEALALASEIGKAAPLAIELIKSAMNRDLDQASLAHAVDGTTHLFVTADAHEGIDAFTNKRPPHFAGE